MTGSTETKCAIVVSDGLATGLAVNAASVLSVTLGARVDGLVGEDVKDADGVSHPGIISTPLPVLTDGEEGISRILRAGAQDDEVFLVGFSALAQSCTTYVEYIDRIAATPTGELETVGVALYGPKKKVNKLVGSLPLLR